MTDTQAAPTAVPAASAATGVAVVTGVSALAPGGIGTADFWDALLEARSGLGAVTRFAADGFPVRVVGEVAGPETVPGVDPRLAVQTDRWSQLAMVATDEALHDAALDPAALPPYDLGVITASSSGGNAFGQREIEALWSKGPRYVGPYQSIAWFYAATTGQLSIRHGMKGPCGVLVAEQAGGLDAIGQARRTVLRGDARVVLTGGTEAPLSPYALTCQLASGLLSPGADPQRAYLPFDEAATGHVPGEGGALLLVEDAGQAAARGAPRPYGEIAGYAATFDPPPGVRPGGGPTALRRAVEGALADAGATPGEVDVVFADAAGSPDLDRAESACLAEVFGPRGVPVTAPKSLYGRLYAGGAPLDVVTALLALRHQVIPPTSPYVTRAAAHPIDLVGRARPARLRTALVVARGYGGFNGAMVLRSTPPTDSHRIPKGRVR
ncbi:ketosynthase chain-length factor [Actinacidiphila epipremni]|uniref:Ketosynthase chain-length factor n=1 Tax=Actinacidiphila epipremni TaxID=2053013 RepID=A0ABX1A0F1_9ACTN|nr:ketosynthase chain-length factor [Actinacidiphila epipremni]NJP47323.1 ketosynthase chain-length factor [Actinacidiphila epipremni]